MFGSGVAGCVSGGHVPRAIDEDVIGMCVVFVSLNGLCDGNEIGTR